MEQQIAYELAVGGVDPQAGLALFIKHDLGQTPDSSRAVIFLQRYMRVAFIAKDFERTAEILKRLESSSIVKGLTSVNIVGLLTHAKLAIVRNDYDAASDFVEQASDSNKEDFFLAYEILIRPLETLLAYKTKDYKEADKLIQRNIKWLRSRRISLLASSWIYFFQIIEALVNYEMTGEPIRQSLLNNYDEKFKPESPDYYILLETELAPFKINAQK
ncbi:MAG: hypothetical protein WCH46_09675 [bacterium]